MKKQNKVFLLLLAVVMIFSFVSTIFCVPTKAEGILKLSIYASYGGGSSSSSSDGTFGHAWIVVENETSNGITVGRMYVSPGKVVSVGTWGNEKDPDTDKTVYGIWYNLESYRGYGTKSTASLTMIITSSQLSTVSTTINNNDEWSIFKTCATFAAKVWNSVCPEDDEVSAGFFAHTPQNLKKSIMKKSAYSIDRSIAVNTYTGYYYLNSNTFKYVPQNRTFVNSAIYEDITSFPKEFDTDLKLKNAILYNDGVVYE